MPRLPQNKAENLSFSLHTLDGKRVATFDQNLRLHSGHHQMSWDAPQTLAEGQYLLAVTSEEGQKVLPVLVVK